MQLAQDLATVAARLDETRADLDRLYDSVRRLAGRVDEMTKADEIARAVTAQLEAGRRRRFTLSRKLIGAAVGIIVLVPPIHDALIWFGR